MFFQGEFEKIRYFWTILPDADIFLQIKGCPEQKKAAAEICSSLKKIVMINRSVFFINGFESGFVSE
jgi:hypothetical protein